MPHWPEVLRDARLPEAAVRQKLKPEGQAVLQQREVAQQDAGALEELEPQPEAQGQRVSPRWEQRLQAAQPEVTLRES